MVNTITPPYKTYVDQIIDYKENVIRALGQCPEIVALMLDDPNVDLESDAARSVFNKYLWDYQYVDDTVQEAGVYIMVEAAQTGNNGNTISDYSLFVEVSVSKSFIDLDHSKFVGMNGNRLDNVVRFVDKVLQGSRDYGIGELHVNDIRPVSTVKQFRSVLLTFNPVDFGRHKAKQS